MAKKNILKTIVLDIEGKEIKLSPEQAKKLHEALDELFGIKEKIQKEYVPYPYNPYPWYPYRIYWQESKPWWETITTIKYASDTTSSPYTLTASNDSLSIKI